MLLLASVLISLVVHCLAAVMAGASYYAATKDTSWPDDNKAWGVYIPGGGLVFLMKLMKRGGASKSAYASFWLLFTVYGGVVTLMVYLAYVLVEHPTSPLTKLVMPIISLVLIQAAGGLLVYSRRRVYIDPEAGIS